jgi:hypothetical protein
MKLVTFFNTKDPSKNDAKPNFCFWKYQRHLSHSGRKKAN